MFRDRFERKFILFINHNNVMWISRYLTALEHATKTTSMIKDVIRDLQEPFHKMVPFADVKIDFIWIS
jgi:hypothetical protein